MNWQKRLLDIITKSKEDKIAVAVDVSTDEYPIETISNIITLFDKVKEETPLILADYKIREITNTKMAKEIPFRTHGRASYTDALEWGQENGVKKLFYITDVTGYFWDELEIDYEIVWLIPDKFKPKVPFEKIFNLV